MTKLANVRTIDAQGLLLECNLLGELQENGITIVNKWHKEFTEEVIAHALKFLQEDGYMLFHILVDGKKFDAVSKPGITENEVYQYVRNETSK